jgi:hypothetical protein
MMKRTMGIAITASALATVSAGTAFAQDAQYDVDTQGTTYEADTGVRMPVRAPHSAFEIQAQGGYAQSFGPAIPRTLKGDVGVGGPGVGAGLGLAYRVQPRASVGIVGSFSQSGMGGESVSRGVSVGVDATWHTNPYTRVDPWLGFGAGYRMIFDQPAGERNDTMIHGFQLGRVTAGVDVRVSDSVAIAPTVGGDVNLFLWRNEEGGVANDRIDRPRLNPTLFAGVTGRFDIGGQRRHEPTQLIGRR